MNKKLDNKFNQWLQKLTKLWDMPVEQVAQNLGAYEVDNRLRTYPRICSTLSASTFDIDRFAYEARQCWALSGRFDAIRLNAFVSKGDSAKVTIRRLIEDFPKDNEEAAGRIDQFVDKVVELGYSTPKGSSDWAGAALLASVILTALYPTRFVDFRGNRWRRFAETFDYQKPSSGAKYGERLIWAGDFAKDISVTETYLQYWAEGESLWVISGICWTGTSPAKPTAEPIDYDDVVSFPEGAKKRRLHLIRERSQAVVSKAKALGLERDPMLRCQVCGFSFLKTYGEKGRDFIEAHHTQPIAELKPGSRTRVEDIALVCANCHRMLHRGEQMSSLDELRNMIQD